MDKALKIFIGLGVSVVFGVVLGFAFLYVAEDAEATYCGQRCATTTTTTSTTTTTPPSTTTSTTTVPETTTTVCPFECGPDTGPDPGTPEALQAEKHVPVTTVPTEIGTALTIERQPEATLKFTG